MLPPRCSMHTRDMAVSKAPRGPDPGSDSALDTHDHAGDRQKVRVIFLSKKTTCYTESVRP
jgi:hypothetical protein